MIFHHFFDEMKKYFLNFFSVEKKNENFSTSSKNIFFEQYYFYEVLRFQFLLESGQPNMICSRDLQCPKMDRKCLQACHALMGPITYVHVLCTGTVKKGYFRIGPPLSCAGHWAHLGRQFGTTK